MVSPTKRQKRIKSPSHEKRNRTFFYMDYIYTGTIFSHQFARIINRAGPGTLTFNLPFTILKFAPDNSINHLFVTIHPSNKK